VALLAGMVTNGWLIEHVFSVPGRASFADAALYPRLLLHVLGHANTQHLFSNIIILLLIGPMLEKAYGIPRMVAISAITAVVTGLLMVLFFNGLLLGASGIVFAMIILSSFANARKGTLPLTFLLVSVLFLGNEILQAIDGVHSGTAHFAHLAGGAVGGVAGFFLTGKR
jgi:membrane associated rhomboid family serine protease